MTQVLSAATVVRFRGKVRRPVGMSALPTPPTPRESAPTRAHATRILACAVAALAVSEAAQGQSTEMIRVSVTVPPVVALSPVTATVAFTVAEDAGEWVQSPFPVALDHAANVPSVLEVRGFRILTSPPGGQAASVELQARARDGAWVALEGAAPLWSTGGDVRRGTVTAEHRIRGVEGPLPPGTWEVEVRYGVRAEEP